MSSTSLADQTFYIYDMSWAARFPAAGNATAGPCRRVLAGSASVYATPGRAAANQEQRPRPDRL